MVIVVILTILDPIIVDIRDRLMMMTDIVSINDRMWAKDTLVLNNKIYIIIIEIKLKIALE